jgi:hypothetical protein
MADIDNLGPGTIDVETERAREAAWKELVDKKFNGDEAAAVYQTLIDGLDINQTGIFDNIENKGVNGKTTGLLHAAGGANDWLTGRIKVANASNLAGRVYIEVRAGP